MIMFLDIDGVLNTTRSIDLWSTSPGNRDNNYLFDDRAIFWINALLERADFNIVIHSTWKNSMNLHQLRDIFFHNNIKSMPVSVTPAGMERGMSIFHWLLGHKGEQKSPYIVIDDNEADIKEILPHKHFVHVKDGWENGFGENEYHKAVESLERQFEWTEHYCSIFAQ